MTWTTHEKNERRTGTGIGYYFPPLPVSWPQYHVLLYLLYLCFVAFTTSPCTTARHRSTAPGKSLRRRLHQDQVAPTKGYRPQTAYVSALEPPGKWPPVRWLQHTCHHPIRDILFWQMATPESCDSLRVLDEACPLQTRCSLYRGTLVKRL